MVGTQSTVGNTSSLPSGTGQFDPGTVSGNGQFTYGIVFGMQDSGGKVGNGPKGSLLALPDDFAAAGLALGVDLAAGDDFFSATFFSSFGNSCYL